jgi:V/A-type H+-transporting ATPase subunit D
MPKIKLTKNELKKQKDNLKRFSRYLPTLQLKKQQLQIEIIKTQKKMEEGELEMKNFRENIKEWIDVFAEKTDIDNLIEVEKVYTRTGNIAGIDIPIFDRVEFKEKEYDLINTPLWIDYGIKAVKKMIAFKISNKILEEQLMAIREELRVTTQRVNLFEKVKIPEAEENINKIQICLGDLETAAVVIGKIAKGKIEKKAEVMAEI